MERELLHWNGIKKVILPSSCKRIEANAFRNNTSLQEVVFSEGLEYIGDDAFNGCINLEKIELPNTVTEIKNRAFYNCKKIKSFIMPNSLENLEGNDLFVGCTSLTNINLGNIKSISGFGIFNGVPADKLIIPKSCNEISSGTLNNANIKQIIVEDGNEKYKVVNDFLTDDSGTCYYVNQSLLLSTDILKIPEGVKYFNTNFAKFTKIKKVVIPQSLTTFSVACYLPSSISEIEVTSGNKTFSVNDNALYSDTKLICCYSKATSYTPKDGTTEIYEYAFIRAPNITEVIFPDSVINTGEYLFANSKITKIKIGKNVKNINPRLLSYDFNGTIEIDSENPYYTYENGSLYNKDKTTLYAVFNKSITTYTLDENVLNIGSYAFYDCRKLSKIIMNNKVKNIENFIFMTCTELQEIELPSSIEKIENDGFSSEGVTSALRKVTIHKKKGDVENWSSGAWGLPIGERGVIWDEE